MKIQNTKIFLLSLFVCVFCFSYLYIKTPAKAQYPANSYYNYYEFASPTLSPSFINNNMYSSNYSWSDWYPNNYSWSKNQYPGKNINIPKFIINEWTVQPAFGNTIYALSNKNEGSSLTIHGTYFSAHTQAGVNFDQKLFMGNSTYPLSNQAMYQKTDFQSSLVSPVSYYARQVLQFSPVLHGPILNY